MVDVLGAARADIEPFGAARLAPVSAPERIPSLDVLRGFAVLGILWMNIITFALPYWAYANPTIYGGATGVNLAAWLWSAVLVEGKMRAIFSMLFGASLVLITSRAEARGAASTVADIYLRRTLWLAAFGLAHAYLLWWGDILFYYGIVGLGLYPFRRLTPRTLILLGALVLATVPPQTILETRRLVHLRAQAQEADAIVATGAALTAEQTQAQQRWEEKRKEIAPTEEDVAKQVEIHRGSYLGIAAERVEAVLLEHTVYFYRWMAFDVVGMMLIGMGLMKRGVLSARASPRVYAAMAAAGFALCCPITWVVCSRAVARGFELSQDLLRDSVYDLTRMAGAFGYIGLVMLVCRTGVLRRLRARLAAAGQMALSNYLLQTLICSTLFYGYGFGRFGMLERYQILLVASAIWIFQLWLSPLWLRHLRFGPMEWVWRSLTYWQRQPMRVREAGAPLA
ncbi:MAG TPA: DUF418 domain-containing protein [Myxococcota bacterium]